MEAHRSSQLLQQPCVTKGLAADTATVPGKVKTVLMHSVCGILDPTQMLLSMVEI